MCNNIPAKETIDYMIDQIWVQRKLTPVRTKLIFKILLFKLATECKFTFSNSFNEQTDRRTTGGLLSFTFSNIYMVKLNLTN